MGKDPALLWYPSDWVSGTQGMSFEEKGAYMEILMMQFSRGHMTERMISVVIGRMWGRIKDKFIQDEQGLWYNKRIDVEKDKRIKYVESRKNNKLGKNQHKNSSKHMTDHMGNENTSCINNIETNGKKTKLVNVKSQGEDVLVERLAQRAAKVNGSGE